MAERGRELVYFMHKFVRKKTLYNNAALYIIL